MGVREARKQARRQAIEEAGLELFLAEGYAGCSVEKIAGAVGIARGTFYLYYPDKRALFELFCERMYGPLVSALEEHAGRLRAAASSEEQRLLYLQMSFSLAACLEQARPLMLLHFREKWSAGPAGEVVGEWMGRVESIAVSILEDARDRGLVRDLDALTVALAIVGAAERLIWAWLAGDERLDADRATLEVANVFFSGIA